MRYIPLHEQRPGQEGNEEEKARIKEWLSKAEDLLQQMEAAADDDARKKIIDDNSDTWGKMKEWLLKLSYNKCWFSEARDCFNHWDVEHFRPKKSVKDLDGDEKMGYWWLAFNWRNFRICGNVGNRKKGTYFPLKAGCMRVGYQGDLRLEEPMLLDPADPYDPSLLSFDMNGNAKLSPGVTDEWETERVRYSIERFNLNNYPPLVDQRKLVWNDCWNSIQQFLYELDCYSKTKSPVALQQFKDRAQKIRAMMKPDQEFSSVARACVLNSGDPRLQGFLTSF